MRELATQTDYRSCARADAWNLKRGVLAATVCAVASIAATPCAAQVATVAAVTQTLSLSEKRVIVEKAGDLLTANYIFPDRAIEAKARIDAALAAREYDSITTAQTFAEKLTSDLRSVTHDKHLGIYPPPAPRSLISTIAAPAPVSQRVYAGFSRVDRLKGNIGYMKLQNFPDAAGPFSQTSTQAIRDLADTDALIIDMRDNGGGFFSGVFYLSSFFFDPKISIHLDSHITRKSGTNEFQTQEFHTQTVPTTYLDKPVYLLTSRRTVSAGETSSTPSRHRTGRA